MDQTSLNQTYRLLALCARAEGHTLFYEQLNRLLLDFTAWDALPAQAELHGMGPLLWHHLQKTDIAIPVETQRSLRALYLRHRALNQAHFHALAELLKLFEQANICPLVLKGLALAYQYYPDPALRPVGDIDLLLKQSDVLLALHLLEAAGYRVNLPNPNLRLLPKELTAYSPYHNGVSTHIELHHYNLEHKTFNDNSPDNEFKDFIQPPQLLMIDGCAIYTSSPMDTLRYLNRHMIQHLYAARVDKPLSLKWSADIINLVERHAGSMDWSEFQRRDPAFLRRLAVLYSLTPLPEMYEKVIPIEKIKHPPGLDQYPGGWPQWPFPNWKRVGFWRYLWRTFSTPSIWWLCLCYGTDEQSSFWYGQVLHRLRVLKLMLWALVRRVLRIQR